jgi:hypothetical protein
VKLLALNAPATPSVTASPPTAPTSLHADPNADIAELEREVDEHVTCLYGVEAKSVPEGCTT